MSARLQFGTNVYKFPQFGPELEPLVEYVKTAERLGFRFEGIFRKHMIIKGLSRDTAWYAMTEDDWPAVRRALEAWLSPANFDAEGRQKRRLAGLRGSA